jgi:dynein heavy chain
VLKRKHTELTNTTERLEEGVEKLKSTAAQVDDLKEKLAAQEVTIVQHVCRHIHH